VSCLVPPGGQLAECVLIEGAKGVNANGKGYREYGEFERVLSGTPTGYVSNCTLIDMVICVDAKCE